jgi:hypothetical protein
MISLDKKYRTRSGSRVKLYTIDGGGFHPVHGAIYSENEKEWHIETWDKNGYYYGPDDNNSRDLIEDKPRIKTKAYLIIYNNGLMLMLIDKKLALASIKNAKTLGSFKAATEIEIDCEEGQELHE